MALPTTPSTPADLPRLPPAKRRSPLRRAPNTLWAGVALAILAGIAVLVRLGGIEGTPVLVAARNLVAGQQVGAGDFRVVDANVPSETTARLLSPADLGALVGQLATHDVAAGELVTRSSLKPTGAPAAQRAISIPLDVSRAVGGSLQVGDVVDVVDTSGDVPLYAAVGARVLATSGTARGGIGGGLASKYSITIGVDERAALAVASAITNGKIDVVRSTGAPPAAPAATFPPPTTPPVPTTAARR